MEWRRKDLLSIEELTEEELELILKTAESFCEISKRDVKKVPVLRGRTIVNMFFEPSTRTRVSFEIAAKRLSADTLQISAQSSSVLKGETLLDTAKNIEALNPDVMVIRHDKEGACHLVAKNVKSSVINAGDGAHEHPTQALSDLLTVRQKFGKIEGLSLLIVGDIRHSRVARSNIFGFSKLGAKVSVCGPKTLIPKYIERLGVSVYTDLYKAAVGKDVIMALRVQRERQHFPFFPSIEEYRRFYGINREFLESLKRDVFIMHPGPVIREVELSGEVCDGKNSLILSQVENGVAVRMAVLYLLMGEKE